MGTPQLRPSGAGSHSKLGTRVAHHAEELAQLEARDTGKPLTQARADIAASAWLFLVAWRSRRQGARLQRHRGLLDGYFVAVIKEPLGVTWDTPRRGNYPARRCSAWTLAPSLVAGNATVLKLAEEACASTPAADGACHGEAGSPPGAINVVTGRGDIGWRRARRASGW